VTQTLPLFPLGTVLFPGLLLPLHIFEDRYRQLVRDLRAGPSPARFGVIAIRAGRETGADGVRALYSTGCTAVVRRVTEHEDGRFDLVTAGAKRFSLVSVDDQGPYLRGEVEMLPDEAGDEMAAAAAAAAVRAAFDGYLEMLVRRGAAQIKLPELPADPVALSYLVAATMILDLPDRQALLAEPDAAARLGAERALLTRETTMLRALESAPAPDIRYSPYSSN
jgi:uncharacterized protein